jgi:hypothetical protein
MNVFEDLVLELKEENLLESTIVEADPAIDTTDDPNVADVVQADVVEKPYPAAPELVEHDVSQAVRDDAAPAPAAPGKPKHGREFFNKRAIAELSSLQMVEHVLTGVEREYLKIIPKTFDDFNAKKALNSLLQISDNSNTEEHKRAEFELMQETESWCSALAARDRNIPVSSLRQYCEKSRPALSSQALLALGRFYRNSPYSESVRAKFDFVITRLFSRAGEDDRRSCLFDREETLGHITRLYADWSSVPLYTADSDESNVLLTALSFEDLAAEAESASDFDQLITTDFFGRLRLFKESISELFYAPNVTAAAIDCNIRIGNAYVKLIEREHVKLDASSIQAKYGDISDQTVSDAAGWTLDLAEIMRTHAQDPVVIDPVQLESRQADIEEERTQPAKKPQKPKTDRLNLAGKLAAQLKSVNKWVLITAAAMVLLCAGLGIWVNYYAEETVSSSGVRGFDLESSPLNEHLKAAKVSGDTFYGLLQPSWDVLPKEKRVEFLQKAFAVAQQQKCKQVNLIGKDGKVAAYASAARTEVTMP